MSKNIQVKAVGDWELEVLGVPFGGPENGKDLDGEYFSERTNTHPDKFPLPPAVYYHGFDPDGKPSGKPEYIGKSVERIEKTDGIWYRVILDKTSEFAKRIWEAAKEGLARASSGSVPHLTRINKRDGHIDEWPVNELSLMDIGDGRRPSNGYAVALPVLKATYKQAGIALPDGLESDPEASARSAAENLKAQKLINKEKNMDEKERLALIEEGKLAAIAERKAADEAEVERQAEIDTAVKAALEAKDAEDKEAKEKLEDEAKKSRRLPDGTEIDGEKDVKFAKMAALAKFDNLNGLDMSILVGVLGAADRTGRGRRASENAYKALAERITNEKESVSNEGKLALKSAGFKTDEIMYQSLSGFGDEWVGIEYSNRLWLAIRQGTFVLGKLPQIEVPPGHESIVIPLEGADPTFFKVAEVNDLRSDSGRPDATITASQVATANNTLSLVKAGARIVWSGELQEDSLVPFVSQLRSQLQTAGSEQLEHAIIDGDTAAGGSANINDIAGTPASTDLFLLFNGFRKSPLVTTTANSRDGGALEVADYKETLRLMGAAGINALNSGKVTFITDVNTAWKTMELEELKTRDVFSNAALENGMITGIYGYEIQASAFMHFKDSDRLANTDGKIDVDTVANNTTGSILAVRWDQWLFGWRRRMTMEVDRFAESDANQIVALFRSGLIQRDTEASTITFNLSVA